MRVALGDVERLDRVPQTKLVRDGVTRTNQLALDPQQTLVHVVGDESAGLFTETTVAVNATRETTSR